MKLTRLAWFALVLMLVLGPPHTAGAQDLDTTITIHLAECPAGYDGNDPFTDCHDNRLAGVDLEWGVIAPGAPRPLTTDSAGVASFAVSDAWIDALGVVIAEFPPYDLAWHSVYCSKDDGVTPVPVLYNPDEVEFGFPINSDLGGGEIVCDWYNVPVDGGDDDGTGEPITLPSTGVAPMSGGIGVDWWLALAALSVGGLALMVRHLLVGGNALSPDLVGPDIHRALDH